jgi:peptide/nickel transport system permease protein
MGLKGYVARRVLEGLLVLFVIMTVIFFLFRATGITPIDLMTGGRLTPELREQLLHRFGLDQPLYKQYFIFLKNTFMGDLGMSFYMLRPVGELIWETLPRTLLLFLPSVIIAYAVGINLGSKIGWKRGSHIEKGLTTFALFMGTVPVFWFCLIMIYAFAYELPLFPLGGWMSTEVARHGTLLQKIIDVAYHMFLPVMTQVIVMLLGALLYMRTSMLDTIGEDYILAARAKGLPAHVVRDKHAARNAMLPVVTAFTTSVALVIGGNILVETIFSWPGLGKLTYEAVLRLDYPLAQGCFLMLSAITIATILVTDVLYAYLDPRVSYG